MKRVLVLGNKGFIGQHLEKYFRKSEPELEITGRDLPESDLTSEEGIKGIRDLFNSDTCVIMLSAIKRQFGESIESFSENIKMAVNVCRLLRERPVGRFVYFSSSAVYGEDIHNTGITEETPPCPTSYYGLAKFVAEKLFLKTITAGGRGSCLIVRPATIYGPGDRGDTYGPVKFTNTALRKEALNIWGDGSELREFIFIGDVVEIAHKLALSFFNGVINLAAGTSYSFRDLLREVQSVSGYKLCVRSRPRTKAKADNAFCNKKLLDTIGHYSFTPLREGIKNLYKHSEDIA